jgi:tRNA pseudouridine38-40 synthase
MTPDAVVRLRLDVSYDGTDFAGWASQPGLRTVQGTLEAALATILRTPSALTVAGRTDAGVHARGQVCHLDLPAEVAADVVPEVLTRRLGAVLPAEIRVRGVSLAPAGFDARFSAGWRRYAYRLCDDPAGVAPLDRLAVLGWPRPLDVGAMNAAAGGLLGVHDFAAFCKRREGATTVRDLRAMSWSRTSNVVVGRVVADAFCHHLVRSLVGSLVAVGEGRRQTDWPREVLLRGQRDPGVLVMPARGLTLEEVGYPADAELAGRAVTARAMRTPA